MKKGNLKLKRVGGLRRIKIRGRLGGLRRVDK